MSRTIYIVIAALFLTTSCKFFAKETVEGWTKSQVRKFVNKCEDKAIPLLGEEKAASYCNCAANAVENEYPQFEEAKDLSVAKVRAIAKSCL